MAIIADHLNASSVELSCGKWNTLFSAFLSESCKIASEKRSVEGYTKYTHNVFESAIQKSSTRTPSPILYGGAYSQEKVPRTEACD